MMRFTIAGVQFDGAFEFSFGAGKVPVVVEENL